MQRFVVLLAVCAVAIFAHLPVWATVVGGRVTTTGGSGIEGIDLDFIDRDTGASIPLTNDTTDILGDYATTVPEGRYDVRFEAPRGVAFVSVEIRGVDVTGANMTMDQVLESGWIVTGRVLGPDLAPIVGFDLDFILAGNKVFTPHDNTDAIGEFSVTVPAGIYQVEFDTPAGSNLVPKRLDGVVITSHISLGDVTLAAGLHLTGRTVDPSTAPVANVKVETLDPATGAVIFNVRNRSDGAGGFDIVVAVGSYNLALTPPAGVAVLPTIVNGVTVTGGLDVGDLVLPAGVLISGQVIDSRSQEISGVNLDFIDVATGIEFDALRDSTDGAGRYNVAVPAGTYDITFAPRADTGLAFGILRNVALPTSTVLPTVVLQDGQSVSGTVVDTLGSPLGGVDLDFNELPGGLDTPLRGDKTNAAGQFFVLVPMGTYDIDFTALFNPELGPLTLTAVPVNGNLDLGMVTLSACSAPGEVSSMVFVTSADLVWAAVPDAVSYALHRGTIEAVFTFNHVCLQPDIVEPAATDATVPAPGTTYYYLGSASSTCGDGGLGFATDGQSRGGNTCP